MPAPACKCYLIMTVQVSSTSMVLGYQNEPKQKVKGCWIALYRLFRGCQEKIELHYLGSSFLHSLSLTCKCSISPLKQSPYRAAQPCLCSESFSLASNCYCFRKCWCLLDASWVQFGWSLRYSPGRVKLPHRPPAVSHQPKDCLSQRCHRSCYCQKYCHRTSLAAQAAVTLIT